ncbi:MAG TPA: hypothetical protein VNM48_23615 [Chloroflexota bacterium]|nr:hypothetical protein [Chloroflexota bacterium]
MVDNLTTQTTTLATVPSASAIATDDVAGVHYQKMKLDLGGDGLSVPVSGSVPVSQLPATLIVTATGAAGAAVTATLPLVAGQFHHITRIELVKYASVATVGAAAPTIITSTNLPGSVAWTLPTALAVGTMFETDVEPASPIRSSAAGVATTIVAAALASIIYRITVYYYTAA